MKAVVILTLALVACVSASAVLERTQFASWKQTHAKTYASKADEAHAFANFRATLARLAKRNGPGFGLNALSDLSPAEFKAQYLTGYTPAAAAAPVLYSADVDASAAPTSFDWRSYDAKAVTAVKDQGQCGSCWAFSATEALESQWYLATHSQEILSPQQTVSCDTVDEGCNGGDLPTAYAYMKSKGVETEKAYPYTSGPSGATGSCKYKAASVVAKISGFSYAIPPCNDSCADQVQYEDALKVAVAAGTSGIHGPPAICVNAEPWQDYVGPAPLEDECSGDYSSLDHCVQLVGYNGDAAVPYWIVRNSWNTDWGVKGYIHIKAGANQCGLLDEVVFPIVAAPAAKSAHARHHKHH